MKGSEMANQIHLKAHYLIAELRYFSEGSYFPVKMVQLDQILSANVVISFFFDSFSWTTKAPTDLLQHLKLYTHSNFK